jgi:hypothetical protein
MEWKRLGWFYTLLGIVIVVAIVSTCEFTTAFAQCAPDDLICITLR